MENDVLVHHGTKGMKWGRRRYQNPDGSLTPEGRARYGSNGLGVGKNGPKLSKKNLKRLQKSEEEKRKREDQEAKEKENYEENKAKAIKSGSASEVLKYKGDLDTQQMQYALNRINWEQNMNNLAAKEVTTGKNKAEKIFGDVDKAVGYAQTAAKAYNMVANIYNAFSNKDISLPKIETDVLKGNKAIRKAEKKAAKKEEAEKKNSTDDKSKEEKWAEEAQKKAEDFISKAKNKTEEARQKAEEKTGKDTESDRTYKEAKKAAKQKEKETKKYYKNTVFEGEVSGEGKSSFKGWKDDGPTIDVDYTTTYSNLPTTNVNYGRSHYENMSSSFKNTPISSLSEGSNSQIEMGRRKIAGLLGDGK